MTIDDLKATPPVGGQPAHTSATNEEELELLLPASTTDKVQDGSNCEENIQNQVKEIRLINQLSSGSVAGGDEEKKKTGGTPPSAMMTASKNQN